MIYSVSQKHCLLKQQIIKKEQIINHLEQLLSNQKERHLTEIKEMYERIQVFTQQKGEEKSKRQAYILKIRQKNKMYKDKYNDLSEKYKQESQKTKIVMKKKIQLEQDHKKLKQLMKKQEIKHDQSKEYIKQQKQAIDLLQKQSKELKLERLHLKQQINTLRKQINHMHQVTHKYDNIQEISQNQYQKQIHLLKNQLQQQFQKNMYDVFDHISSEETFSKTKENRETYDCYRQKDLQVFQEQLQRLINSIQYGEEYFLLEVQLFNNQSFQKIYNYLLTLITIKRDLIIQSKTKDQEHNIIIQDLKEKLSYFGDSIEQIKISYKKEVCIKYTQTVQNYRINDLHNLNNIHKIKNYAFQNIISFMSEFIIYLLQIIKQNIKKEFYYHYTQLFLHKTIQKKVGNRFKKIGIAILFIKMLEKKRNRRRKIHINDKYRRENIERFIIDGQLANLLNIFQKKTINKIYLKNHKIEELSKSKFTISYEEVLLEILNQEYLNRKVECDNFQDYLGKFMFRLQNIEKYKQK